MRGLDDEFWQVVTVAMAMVSVVTSHDKIPLIPDNACGYTLYHYNNHSTCQVGSLVRQFNSLQAVLSRLPTIRLARELWQNALTLESRSLHQQIELLQANRKLQSQILYANRDKESAQNKINKLYLRLAVAERSGAEERSKLLEKVTKLQDTILILMEEKSVTEKNGRDATARVHNDSFSEIKKWTNKVNKLQDKHMEDTQTWSDKVETLQNKIAMDRTLWEEERLDLQKNLTEYIDKSRQNAKQCQDDYKTLQDQLHNEPLVWSRTVRDMQEETTNHIKEIELLRLTVDEKDTALKGCHVPQGTEQPAVNASNISNDTTVCFNSTKYNAICREFVNEIIWGQIADSMKNMTWETNNPSDVVLNTTNADHTVHDAISSGEELPSEPIVNHTPITEDHRQMRVSQRNRRHLDSKIGDD